MAQLKIKTALQISKPKAQVFDAIVDPQQMTQYFISEASGKIEEGQTILWKFPEFEESVTIHVTKVVDNEQICYQWEGAKGKDLNVAIFLQEVGNGNTLVKITEGEMESDEAGLNWFGGNTEGWANFLACLKAYLEYGINLRKGAFDFLRSE